jgi:hypothetical protein
MSVLANRLNATERLELGGMVILAGTAAGWGVLNSASAGALFGAVSHAVSLIGLNFCSCVDDPKSDPRKISVVASIVAIAITVFATLVGFIALEVAGFSFSHQITLSFFKITGLFQWLIGLGAIRHIQRVYRERVYTRSR